jgi:IclR family KDG regulon transcriptional repressor
MKYQAPTVKKAFRILRLISDAEHGLRISELAKSLDMSKGTIHGITSALEEVGAVNRDPVTKRYKIDYTIVELGKKALSRAPLRKVARRHMEWLVEEIGDNAFLGIRKGHHILILDVVESNRALKITSPSGAMIPLSAGATGKLFLASMDEKSALRYLKTGGLLRYTEHTITDLDIYIQVIREARKRGFATDYEEYLHGVRAVAARIETEEPLLAAIWVVGFSSSLTDDRMEFVIERTIAAANAISRDLRRSE